MLKDRLLRFVFIPLLGIVISYVSGIITYSRYNMIEIMGGLLYFVLVSFCIWRGCQWIHARMRNFYTIGQNPFSKIASVCAISGLYGIAVAGMFALMWLRISREDFHWAPVIQ